tara:strand:+ start:48 stop:485 length:438 start_codon:yes stop_codon:yes gene_type:complete
MTSKEQKQFLNEGWTLQVATNGPAGFPHLAAMWYVIIDGIVHFTTFGKSQKILNLQRDGHITAMLETGQRYEELRGLVIRGTGQLDMDPQTTASVMSVVANKYQGMPIPTETPEAAMPAATKRVTVRILPEQIYSWDHTKLGGRY